MHKCCKNDTSSENWGALLNASVLQRFVALCYATVCYNKALRTATKLFLSSLEESDM